VLFVPVADQREEIHEVLVDELGGTPEDYDAQAALTDQTGEPVAESGTSPRLIQNA
jgi:hypothetical protein